MKAHVGSSHKPGPRPDPAQYSCYRSFICDFMKHKRLSYRAFSARFTAYVSFPFLSKLLRRNSSGQFLKEVNLRPEKLAALLKAMGLNPPEISHLVLCRLRNDQVQGHYRHSSAYTQVIQNLAAQDEANLPSLESRILSALQALAPQRRRKVVEELNHQLEIEIARSTSNLKSEKLRQLKVEEKVHV